MSTCVCVYLQIVPKSSPRTFSLVPCFLYFLRRCVVPYTCIDYFVSFYIVMLVSFCDYFNFCQDKNNWCGYYYSFSCWCNWRSLTWLLCIFLCMVDIIKCTSMLIRGLLFFQGWTIYVIGQTTSSLLYPYIQQHVILRSLLLVESYKLFFPWAPSLYWLGVPTTKRKFAIYPSIPLNFDDRNNKVVLVTDQGQ